MDSKCTCRTTRRERFLNPDCPIHGEAEMQRRHQRARLAERIRRETGLSPSDVEMVLREGRCYV